MINHNCQHFASEIFSQLGLKSQFSAYDGEVGDFIQYVAKYQSEELYPCVLKEGKPFVTFKTHQELDDFEKNEGDKHEGKRSLLKGFHRGWQARKEKGVGCPHNHPTLLLRRLESLYHFAF